MSETIDNSATTPTPAATPVSPAPSVIANAVPQIEQILSQAARNFQSNNGAAVQQLGSDVVNAIFATQVATYFPALSALPANPTAADIAAHSDLTDTRTSMFAVVSQAEAQYYATVHALKLSAVAEISSVITSILGIIGGVAVKYLATAAPALAAA